MNETLYDTPVLLIVFNRPDTTRKVFQILQRIKPINLFVAADGPREGKPYDKELCAEVRSVFTQINWPCKLKTLFREENKGCGRNPAEAITWFFEHVEYGIILEDDCLAHDHFFLLCAELLPKYQMSENVFTISGSNPLLNWKADRYSYFLCKNGSMFGGWATWKRAWAKFDHTMTSWFESDGQIKLSQVVKNRKLLKHLTDELNIHCHPQRQKDVWDYQWLFARLVNEAISIVPSVNLISNIGFREDGTHTKNENDRLANQKQFDMLYPVKHPSLAIDRLYDWLVYEMFSNPYQKSIVERISIKAVKLLNNINI